jgi:hypothetical protein
MRISQAQVMRSDRAQTGGRRPARCLAARPSNAPSKRSRPFQHDLAVGDTGVAAFKASTMHIFEPADACGRTSKVL